MTRIFLPRKVAFLAAASSALALSACGSGPPIEPGYASTQPVAALGQDGFTSFIPATHQLRANDKIDVIVFREAELSLEGVQISSDGTFSMPLLGQVQAAGKTMDQLASEIELLLNARYLRNASVAINVVGYDSHTVTVEGAVRRPGIYAFNPGTRLSGGLALAQGFERTAATSEIAIIRQSDQGLQIAKFEYRGVRDGSMMDPVLQPGDRVIVDTDGLSQFWQDLLKALPAFGLFSNVQI